MRFSVHTIVRIWSGLLILGVLVTASGCGGSSKGSVSGTVSYKGQNLKGGRVTFVDDQKEAFPTEISEDGKYAVPNLPPGNYKVCVETAFLKPSPEMTLMAKTRPAGAKVDDEEEPDFASRSKRYVAIPAKYVAPEQTTLTYTVKGGKQEYDIKLD